MLKFKRKTPKEKVKVKEPRSVQEEPRLEPEPESGQSEPKNSPYLAYLMGRREWNERYGEPITTANNWRLTALSAILIALIAVSGLVVVAQQHKVVPYFVEFNEHSEVVRVVRAEAASRPNVNQIRALLRKWVIGARTVYVDLRAQQDIVNETYATTLPDSPAYRSLAAYHREHNPYQRAAKETVEVTVTTVIPVSEETWQVEWVEETKQRSGKLVGIKHWQGSLTITLRPPEGKEQIVMNPLGTYVHHYAWTTRLAREE